MDPKRQETAVRCWSCGLERGLAELLDASPEIVCQPVCDCFTVSCAGCGAQLWLEFTNRDSVVVGQLIGFGARPDILDYQSVSLGGPVDLDFGRRAITYAGKVWRYR
jgi:hypothetical protein